MKLRNIIFVTILLLCLIGTAQTASITGIVLDEENTPLPNTEISSGTTRTFSDDTGFYLLELVSDVETTITFAHIGHQKVILENLLLNTNETYEFHPVLKSDALQVDEVTVTANGNRDPNEILSISPEKIRKIPGANAGVENILKLLPGVTSNNELSTQYSVRGGNYDENLVYINEIEVYRPFLVRSAQQEGLSFVNSDLVQDVMFSPGGFQAKYGDKLSSVLDIKYKIPTSFNIMGDFSFLGASVAMDTRSKNKRLSSTSGFRYRNNALLLNSLQTQGSLQPTFTDFQSFVTYQVSNKFNLNFLGNLSVNNYKNEPRQRQTNFGTITDPKALTVFYEGRENNRFATALGAIKGNYYLNDNTTLKLIASLYHTTEEEYSDIIASYRLGEVDSNLGSDEFGQPTNSRGVGSQFNRARNDLDALIFNFSHRGIHQKNKVRMEWGLKYTHEDIRDQLRESEFIDSLGFSVRPPGTPFVNNQPEEPFLAPLEAYQSINALNFVKTNRFSGFLQMGAQTDWKSNVLYYNLGIRAHFWTVSGRNVEKVSHMTLSPRIQIALKPNWKRDMLFRIATGLYQQPPFYRELRDSTGTINPNVDAQKSLHIVAGNEYSFLLWNRPFSLTSEGYYKKLTQVNPYTLEDVRIRYSANNNAEAYVYGAELRLNGAFVPGTESWVSLGYMETKENRNNRGYISRPTDQRLKMGILFQDYIPNMPELKMYLNLVYATGVPGGSPSYADPYIFQNRLRDYKRADLGISYIFADKSKNYPERHWLHAFKNLSVGFEIFNMFNNQNSITNTWVRDVDSKTEFAIPNYLTSRVLNLRVQMRL
ncbi:TonB-dependent receptor plug domain-containing protein [Maribacter sp. 4G9]|uniref:TonB-dependent receptor n=1 Tax=Maribacter sp. 4G9 TaxID=1889777 RepID=UPI000C609271|nr:TonB-dependent receptor plug domain-containing protein [Maribacter sp. 4G9]PIB38858.1 TonB-dependent receptor [Maribacter sp. 4G9]